ncbi:beta-galactosidase [Caldalkalibacillus salinus]|uniref:beta-galactosidase n=1 Tax=Caldalkalibacillus salinus TaxID=2803787 RepID=UPI0019239AEB|nr:beta-galactosidase [Caldalkalibacillus salinus]
MSTLPDTQKTVYMNRDGIYINHQPVIILCSSLFYFRIPQGLWKDRLQKVKEAGYNCIDVYFPWNFHEVKKGKWDFTGDRDVAQFLQLAADEGLWVMARPGPYICSEWDGGGLPAYLFTENLTVRDHDSLYLAYVSEWFEQIMPILKKYEVGQQGTIMAIQLENELDFYPTADREGYMTALRQMAEEHHIAVPLLACAGQGDLYGATGDVQGVMPACNFYPHDQDPQFETSVYHHYRELQKRHHPLCVTETNRTHFLLKRLLSVGTKLLGPYNQVSGTDFGFSNSINNWGQPLAFMTSDYNFGGMVTPEGTRTEEFYEGRLLSQFIHALGSSLAEAHPVQDQSIRLETQMTPNAQGPYRLTLKGGGSVLFIPNLDDQAHQVVIKHGEVTLPQQTTFTISPHRCAMVLYDVPLTLWGLPGVLSSTAELGLVQQQDETKYTMLFHTEHEAELSLTLPQGTNVVSQGMGVTREGETWRLTFSALSQDTSLSDQRVSIEYEDGTCLFIIGTSREQAKTVNGITSDGELIHMRADEMRTEGPTLEEKATTQKEHHLTDKVESDPVVTSWSYKPINEASWLSDAPHVSHAMPLEQRGYLRGYGWYTCRYHNEGLRPIKGILLHEASDVVSLYANDDYHGTVTPGGGDYFYALPSSAKDLNLRLRTEIWGHTNFHAPLLPALAMNALKGIRGLTIVHRYEDINDGWAYLPVETERAHVPVYHPQDVNWKRANYDGFLTSAQPKRGYYHTRRTFEGHDTRHILHFKGINAKAKCYIDGSYISGINPLNPFVNISPYIQHNNAHDIVIYLEQHYGESGGKISLLSGREAQDWRMFGMDEDALVQKMKEACLQEREHGEYGSGKGLHDRHHHECDPRHAHSKPNGDEGALPLRVPPGQIGCLSSCELQRSAHASGCFMLYPKGKNVKVTAIFNERIVGRVWLPSQARPTFSGGRQDSIYLPRPLWKTAGNELHFLVEAIDRKEEGTIEELRFEEVTQDIQKG